MYHGVSLMGSSVSKSKKNINKGTIDSDKETKSTPPYGLRDNNTNVRQDDHSNSDNKVREEETSDLTEKDTCNVNESETAEEFTFWGTEEL